MAGSAYRSVRPEVSRARLAGRGLVGEGFLRSSQRCGRRLRRHPEAWEGGGPLRVLFLPPDQLADGLKLAGRQAHRLLDLFAPALLLDRPELQDHEVELIPGQIDSVFQIHHVHGGHGSVLPLGRAPDERGQVAGLVADLAVRPVALEEAPGLLIAHAQRDRLLAAPALDVELDHGTTFHSWPMRRVCHERRRRPIRRGALTRYTQPSCQRAGPGAASYKFLRDHTVTSFRKSAAAMTGHAGSGLRGVKNGGSRKNLSIEGVAP